MDLDCTFYFWKRKLFSLCAGLLFGGALFAVLLVGTENEKYMCAAYGTLMGLIVGVATNTLMAESYCTDCSICSPPQGRTIYF